MVSTVYGSQCYVSEQSQVPPDTPRQFLLEVAGHHRTRDEMKQLLRQEILAKRNYLPQWRMFILSLDERYWTADFIRHFEGQLPSSVIRTVVKLVRRNAYELTLRFDNVGGSLDGVPRALDDTTMPLSVQCSLVITLDALVGLKAQVLNFIHRSRHLTSLTILPPLRRRARLDTTYLDTVVQVMSTLDSSVSVNVIPAWTWSKEDIEEIEYVLDTRRQ